MLEQAPDESIPTIAPRCRLVPTSKIVEGKNARRHYPEKEHRELCEAIRSRGGLEEPIKVRPLADGTFELVFGYRRVRALRALELDTGDRRFMVALALIEPLSDRDAALSNLGENFGRQALTIYELGLRTCELAELGISPADVAGAVGKSVDHVERCQRVVTRCIPEILTMLERAGEHRDRALTSDLLFYWSRLEPEHQRKEVDALCGLTNTTRPRKTATARPQKLRRSTLVRLLADTTQRARFDPMWRQAEALLRHLIEGAPNPLEEPKPEP